MYFRGTIRNDRAPSQLGLIRGPGKVIQSERITYVEGVSAGGAIDSHGGLSTINSTTEQAVPQIRYFFLDLK